MMEGNQIKQRIIERKKKKEAFLSQVWPINSEVGVCGGGM